MASPCSAPKRRRRGSSGASASTFPPSARRNLRVAASTGMAATCRSRHPAPSQVAIPAAPSSTASPNVSAATPRNRFARRRIAPAKSPATFLVSALANTAEVARTVAIPPPNHTASASDRSATARRSRSISRSSQSELEPSKSKLEVRRRTSTAFVSALRAPRSFQRPFLLQLLHQRRPVQPQDLRRLVLVPSGALQRLPDQPVLDVRQHLVQIHSLRWQRRLALPFDGGRRRRGRCPRVADRPRQIGHLDLAFALEDGEPLDQVLQLAHVPRPGVPLERFDGARGEAQRLLLPRVVPGEEVRREQGHVTAALAQRRQHQRHHVEAVEQVAPEGALLDLRLEVLVGRGDQPEVHRFGLAPTHRLDRALLQHAEQLALQRERHLADLVQEDGPAVRRLEPGQAVHRLGDQLLARAALSLDEHRAVRGSDPDQRVEDVPDCLRGAHQPRSAGRLEPVQPEVPRRGGDEVALVVDEEDPHPLYHSPTQVHSVKQTAQRQSDDAIPHRARAAGPSGPSARPGFSTASPSHPIPGTAVALTPSAALSQAPWGTRCGARRLARRRRCRRRSEKRSSAPTPGWRATSRSGWPAGCPRAWTWTI